MQGIGKWLERDTEGKTQGAPETKKEGLTNLISCREKKWLQKGIDVINVLISTRLHTASDANKHRQEIIELGAQNSCFNPHMRGLTASEKTDVSTGAIAALEPGCADTTSVSCSSLQGRSVLPWRQCFPDFDFST